MVDWLELKKEEDLAEERPLRDGGDHEPEADIEHMFTYRGEELKSIEELRACPKALAGRIDAEAEKEHRRIDEEKREARIKALEAYAATQRAQGWKMSSDLEAMKVGLRELSQKIDRLERRAAQRK